MDTLPISSFQSLSGDLNTVFIVDYSWLTHSRHHAFYIKKAEYTVKLPTRDVYTGAMYGVLSAIKRLCSIDENSCIILCLDGKDRDRLSLLESYKESRKSDNKYIFSLSNETLCSACMLPNVCIAENEFFEADDLIFNITNAFLSLESVKNIYIYSKDSDLYQNLISDKVAVFDKIENWKPILYTKKDLLTDYGVTPNTWALYKSLVGDTTDCIPPVYPRIFKKNVIDFCSCCETPEQLFALPMNAPIFNKFPSRTQICLKLVIENKDKLIRNWKIVKSKECSINFYKYSADRTYIEKYKMNEFNDFLKRLNI